MARALKSGKSKSSAAPNPKSAVDEAVEKVAKSLLKQLEGMSESKWEKPWITGFGGLPQNIEGRLYSGMNNFLLQLHSMQNGYSVPAYMTFLQMKDLCKNEPKEKKIMIKKGEEAMPVFYWNFTLKDKNGNKVKKEDYEKMSEEEKMQIERIPFLKYYPVFNVDQTNMKEVMPEKYEQIQKKFNRPELRDTVGMYSCPEIDEIFKNQSWHCPIRYEKPSDRAFFSMSLSGESYIVMPQKQQFNKGGTEEEIYAHGMRYYATAMHEMGHSTCIPLQIDITGGFFGNEKYALEELRAEMTAATLGSTMGFDVRLRENHAKYVESWSKALKEEPVKALTSVLPKVSRTVDYMLSKIDEQRIMMGMEPLRDKLEKNEREENGMEKTTKNEDRTRPANVSGLTFPNVTLKDGTVFDEVKIQQLKDQTWGISFNRNGNITGPVRMTPKDFESFGMKQTSLTTLAEKYYSGNAQQESQQKAVKRAV